MISEVALVADDEDNGLRERLDKEINAFNAAATGYADGRLLCIAVREDGGDLRAGLTGWTWGGCGYIDLLWVRSDQRGSGLGTRLLAAAEEEMARRAGWDVVVLEASPMLGGAIRTAELTAPGYRHEVFSCWHPL